MNKQGQSPSTSSGQSTIEYMLLVTAVVAVAILLTVGPDSKFQQRLSNTIDITTLGMQAMANRLTNAEALP